MVNQTRSLTRAFVSAEVLAPVTAAPRAPGTSCSGQERLFSGALALPPGAYWGPFVGPLLQP